MLPDVLEIPLIIAATLRFEGELTARDRSLLLAVSFIAGKDGVGDDDTVRVPDLPLRRALGGIRRPDEKREFARYERLEAATMKTDERVEAMAGGVAAPVVQRGMRRLIVGGAFQWEIDPAIATAFAIENGDEIVEVPLQALVHSRSRYTLPLLIRVLAWGSGEYPRKWRRAETERWLTLRIPVADFRAEIGIDKDTKPADLLRHCVTPAVTEIASSADHLISVEPVQAPGRRTASRVMYLDVRMPKLQTKFAERHVHQKVFGGLIKRFPTKPVGPDDLTDDTPF